MNVFHDNQTALMDGSRFFYIKEFQQINATRMIDLENHFANLKK